MIKYLGDAGRGLLSLLLPERCHVCGAPLPTGVSHLCRPCLASLPMAGYDIDHNPMTDLLAALPCGTIAIAALRYEPQNAAAILIHDIKYHGYSRLAFFLGREMAGRVAPTGIFHGVDLLISVPLHRSRQRKRGYNQADMIARGISSVTGIPVGRQLRAVRAHGTQTRLNRDSRRANVAGVFALRHPEQIEGLTVLLIDDVFTTGATMLSAADTIATAARAVSIRLFALATAHR